MKDQIQSPFTIVICLLIAAYLGGFFWIRASCAYEARYKTYYLLACSPKGKIGWKYYWPIFWIDEKLFGEKFADVGW